MEFRHPRPARTDAHEAFFDCPVEFDAPADAIELELEWFKSRSVYSDQHAFEACARKCDELARRYRSTGPVSISVAGILSADLRRAPSPEAMAERLGISCRTLRRRLHAEGTNYEAILDGTRRRLALDYLTESDLTPKEIAYALGYQNVSSFYRAFKKWSGMTVSAFRANN